jgi:hypothetical protein
MFEQTGFDFYAFTEKSAGKNTNITFTLNLCITLGLATPYCA